MRFLLASVTSLVMLVTGCGADRDRDPIVRDAAPTTVPRDPSGGFAVATSLDLTPTPAAATVIEALDRAAADPSRFLLDRMIARLPAGPTRTVAMLAVPYVAAYLDVKLVEIAPKLAPGLQALASGFARIASHLQLLEAWQIDPSGDAVRTVPGVRFDVGPPTTLVFAAHGLADLAAVTRVELDSTGHLAIPRHALALRYGAIVRAGLDEVVAPSADPTAHDVASALSALVDCTRLGAAVADRVGLGTPALYSSACVAAMVAVAAELDEHVVAIDASPLVLELAGTGTGLDQDYDGTMDAIHDGRWTGAAGGQALAATFVGTRAR